MAKKRKGRIMKRKIDPAVQTFQLVTGAPAGGSNTPAGQTEQFYCDLSQIASLTNRRFYRQGLNWAVGSIKILTSVDGVLTVSKLPNTWTMSNAWQKGLAVWQRMNDEATDEADSIKPRFLDFKIYADSRHHKLGFGANLLPYSVENPTAGGANVLHISQRGEWEASKMIIPKTDGTDATNSRELIAVGASYPGAGASTFNAVSLIEGYASSRGLPYAKDPNTPGQADDASGTAPENWMVATFNEGTIQDDQVIEDMITENNQAPYPFEGGEVPPVGSGVYWTDTQYPGGENQLNGLELHDNAFITPTTIGGATRVRGGNFPCGLMCFSWTPTEQAGNIAIQLEMVPGPHRGYLAMPMQEM